MNILINSVYHISSKNGGGNEQHAHQLAKYLAKNNHITYLCSDYRKINNPDYKIKREKLPELMGKPLVNWQWIKAVWQEDFEVYHSFGMSLALSLGALVAKYGKKKQTIITYPADSFPSFWLFKLGASMEKFLVKIAFDKVICTTPFYKERLKEQWPKKEIYFVPLMISEHIKNLKISKNKARKELNLNERKKLILFIGKLSSHQFYKGLDVLIEAIKKTPEDYQLVIVGDGNRKKDYENLVEKEGLKKKIIFKGFVKNEEISKYFKACDLLVLPSTSASEGFGLVLIEGMSCKLKTLTTKVIGSAEWFEKEKVSNFAKTGDSDDLAKKIIKVINSKNENMIKRAYKFSKQFSLENMGKKTEGIYKEKKIEKINKFYEILYRKEPVFSIMRKRKEKGRLLDIGCGDGKFLSFAEKYYDCYGFDSDKLSVGLAKRICKKAKISYFDIYKLENYKQNSFDIVTCFDVLEHVNHLTENLTRIRKKMKDDGIFVMSSVNTDCLGKEIKWENWYGFTDKTHINFLNKEEWEIILKKAGFIPIKFYYNGLTDTPYFKFVPSILQKIVFKYFLQGLSFLGLKLPKKWGETLMVVCIKNPYLIYNPNFNKKLLV